METMQAEYWKQNYVMSNTVSCDRTDGEISAGIFSVHENLLRSIRTKCTDRTNRTKRFGVIVS